MTATGLLTKEMAGEVLCPLAGAHHVRIEKAAGYHQRVKLLGTRLIQRKIHIELVAFIRVIHTLNFVGFQRHDFRLRSGFIYALRGFVISTCSKPSATRMATFFPSSFRAIRFPPVNVPFVQS